MHIFRPKPASREQFSSDILSEDLDSLRKFGPAGVSNRAVYINTYFLDRRYYIPLTAINRIFKRVAMTKGGFSGKGMFASVSYIVVQFDDGKEIQGVFKREEDADRMLAFINERYPEIKTLSKAGEERIERFRREEKKRYLKKLSEKAEAAISELERQKAYLSDNLELATNLALLSRALRKDNISKKSLKWVATFIVLLGILSAIFGIYSLINGNNTFSIYFTIFGLAAIFLFSGFSIIPSGARSRKRIIKELDEARTQMDKLISGYPGFSIPSRYAHPIVIERMIRVIKEGRAEDIESAYDVMKADIKKLNSDVQVSQQEYDEIVLIKPMFLLEDYR